MLFHTVNQIVYISFVNIQFSFYATKLVINYISDRALRIGDIQAVCFFDMPNINSGMLYIQVLFQLNLTQVPYRKENLVDSMSNLAFYHQFDFLTHSIVLLVCVIITPYFAFSGSGEPGVILLYTKYYTSSNPRTMFHLVYMVFCSSDIHICVYNNIL